MQTLRYSRPSCSHVRALSQLPELFLGLCRLLRRPRSWCHQHAQSRQYGHDIVAACFFLGISASIYVDLCCLCNKKSIFLVVVLVGDDFLYNLPDLKDEESGPLPSSASAFSTSFSSESECCSAQLVVRDQIVGLCSCIGIAGSWLFKF